MNEKEKIEKYFQQIKVIEEKLRNIDNGISKAIDGEVPYLHSELFNLLLGIKLNLKDLDIIE